ncbi:class I SAM-dependent methyltransferase [Streptomyces alkaliphilus]|uniref:class I SAM-dependent methyltransferase n=1 Tax=Streptomyces alkaliphilus TaxID=1472722 RepID=UPI001180EDD6|nr:class I SAM-dependent methyltransferase [Streptomyces alkaliphilus]MQS08922.1 methyltransferase domain-containing protein [Streptomyces alkaliphilus]
MSDPYVGSAEYLDLLIAGFWEAAGPEVASVLAELPPGPGPVVDLGAGSGRGVRVLGEAVPGAPVLAVEPSAVMRAALMPRILDDPGLRDRVTVLPGGALDEALPEGVRAVLALNMLGHLAGPERRELLERVLRSLVPGGLLVTNLAPPFTPVAVPRVLMARTEVGELVYEGYASAEPSGADGLLWRMEYRTLRGDAEISAATVEYPWCVCSEEELAAEATGLGFGVRRVGDPALGLHVLGRPSAGAGRPA